ncbi:unnamed protein product [Oncorhynchus mykiss]|uniref:BRCT domain-containing protein n=1 Tax=Oncorhynchus mykiss TaxID=8022 RepID=A0A060WN98_ONCMY|nr:unnamed protein product [Oncorhynchus mykiss]
MQQHPPGAGGCFMGMLSPGHGARKLEGKSFYLDAVKSRPAAFLAEAISHLGGRIESFLNKDVSFVVTGSLEGLRSERFEVTRGGSDGMTGECHSSPRSTKPRESIMTSTRQQRPATGTPRPMVWPSIPVPYDYPHMAVHIWLSYPTLRCINIKPSVISIFIHRIS